MSDPNLSPLRAALSECPLATPPRSADDLRAAVSMLAQIAAELAGKRILIRSDLAPHTVLVLAMYYHRGNLLDSELGRQFNDCLLRAGEQLKALYATPRDPLASKLWEAL